MEIPPYYSDERRFVPLLWSVVAAVVVGILAAGAAYVLASATRTEPVGAEPASQSTSPSEPAPPTTTGEPPPETTAAPPATPSDACATALAQADAVVQRSAALEQVLTEHTRIMEELLAQRLTAEQALDQTLPVLVQGATERNRFEDELAAYEASRETCAD